MASPLSPTSLIEDCEAARVRELQEEKRMEIEDKAGKKDDTTRNMDNATSNESLGTLLARMMQTIRTHGRSLERMCRGTSTVTNQMPSPLCCMEIMHIRTATYWIAYAEMMWITTQFAFWMAQLVVGTMSVVALILGMVTVIIQSILVYQLCKGTKYFILPPIEIYQVGVVIRVLVCVIYLVIATYVHLCQSQHNFFAFFRSLFWPKVIFISMQLFLESYAYYIAARCHAYIKYTMESLEEESRDENRQAPGTINGCSRDRSSVTIDTTASAAMASPSRSVCPIHRAQLAAPTSSRVAMYPATDC